MSMSEDTIIAEAAEIAAVARDTRDIDDAAEGCRIALKAIRQGNVDWLGDVDPATAAERLAEDVAVLTLAAQMRRAFSNGSGECH
jgi:hypothetical protein